MNAVTEHTAYLPLHVHSGIERVFPARDGANAGAEFPGLDPHNSLGSSIQHDSRFVCVKNDGGWAARVTLRGASKDGFGGAAGKKKQKSQQNLITT
ncbi:hypothetical protein PG989_007972 [Apiospora arundinis]